MKLVINYDFVDAIRNVNEPFNAFKIIRNNKNRWTRLHLPIYMTINLVILQDMIRALGILGIQFGTLIGNEIIANKITQTDIYSVKSSNNLKRLTLQLNNLNLSTEYNLLLQSELYEKKYKIEFNEDKLPIIAESKYILVPNYSYNGEIKNTSILQEHEVGSDVYLLSIGSPQKVFKLARSTT